MHRQRLDKTRVLLLATGLGLLSACTSETFGDFHRTAGSSLESSGLGSATRNNTAVQTGDQSYAAQLAGRFDAEVPVMVNFEFNSATLDAAAQASLREQANWIRQFPEIRFRVYGHTDLVGPAAYNKQLGLRRAQAVVSFLVGQGIGRNRLEAVASFGETRPLVNTQDRERRNRRTVTEVTGFITQANPMPLDGKYAAVVFREYVASGTEKPTIETTESVSE